MRHSSFRKRELDRLSFFLSNERQFVVCETEIFIQFITSNTNDSSLLIVRTNFVDGQMIHTTLLSVSDFSFEISVIRSARVSSFNPLSPYKLIRHVSFVIIFNSFRNAEEHIIPFSHSTVLSSNSNFQAFKKKASDTSRILIVRSVWRSSWQRLASERLVEAREVENFVGEVTFLATPRGVDYEPTLHSLVCELHEHLSKRVLRSLRNSITSHPDILLLFFLIHYPAKYVQRVCES